MLILIAKSTPLPNQPVRNDHVASDSFLSHLCNNSCHSVWITASVSKNILRASCSQPFLLILALALALALPSSPSFLFHPRPGKMGLFNRKGKGGEVPALGDPSPSPALGQENKYQHEVGPPGRLHVDDMNDPTKRLKRGLQARQVTMIAIGGAIGTGLIIGTGASLAKAGPLSILISYSIVGFIVWIVMCALGEMATWLPLESGFTGYATRFCDPALGFSLGYIY